ncbi:MAG: hypothetical protein UR27_C0023G0004 [Candidatus Peregrinibacteria bacterium GW2011_GWA2_33_10]|nr:MAG: hypothetical protein UR27_C0023G0004 [Candidatus Peregrinibacteria bacterium GW2011_GWA2_33_10]KKP38348.1 MAG: hypothetical protein UR30_C0020G0004 [Candidatus Peregrinibacteria bacterium GW2011_GWC2_33_13]
MLVLGAFLVYNYSIKSIAGFNKSSVREVAVFNNNKDVDIKNILISDNDLDFMNYDNLKISMKDNTLTDSKKVSGSKFVITETDFNDLSYMNYAGFPKPDQAIHQLIIKSQDNFSDSMQIRYYKFSDSSKPLIIKNNNYFNSLEKFVENNFYCTELKEILNTDGKQYSFMCGFIYENVYVEISSITQGKLNNEIKALLDKIYDKMF